jgi:hypothetical protein
MPNQPRGPSSYRLLIGTMAGCVVVWIGIGMSDFLPGAVVIPGPMHAFICLLLAVITVLTGTALLAHRNKEYTARVDRRLTAILNAIIDGRVETGLKLEEITGEIPKVRPIVTACAHGVVDPTVVDLGTRLSRRLARSDD